MLENTILVIFYHILSIRTRLSKRVGTNICQISAHLYDAFLFRGKCTMQSVKSVVLRGRTSILDEKTSKITFFMKKHKKHHFDHILSYPIYSDATVKKSRSEYLPDFCAHV